MLNKEEKQGPGFRAEKVLSFRDSQIWTQVWFYSTTWLSWFYRLLYTMKQIFFYQCYSKDQLTFQRRVGLEENIAVELLAHVLPVLVKSGLLDPLYFKEDMRQEKSHRSSFLELNLQDPKLQQGMGWRHACRPLSRKDAWWMEEHCLFSPPLRLWFLTK